MAKTLDEQIAELQKKQAQLKEKEKVLKAKQTQAERKARTKRLIELGAVVEKGLNMEFREQEQRDKLLRLLTEEIKNQNGDTCTWGMMINRQLGKMK